MRRNARFFVVVVALLSLFCFYVGSRLIPDAWPALAQAAGWIAIAAVIVEPVAALVARSRGLARGDSVFWIALAPVGLFLMVLTFTVVRDVVWLGASIAGWLPADGVDRRALHDWTSFVVVVVGVLLFALSLWRAQSGPRVVHVRVPVRDLQPELEGFTVVQLSDIHIGRSLRRPFLERVVDVVNALEADLIAVTGDLVDGSVDDLRDDTAPLASLKATHGAWFVPGNHDYYSGVLPWIAEVKRLGLRVLLNEHHVIEHDGGGRLVVGGVTDHSQGASVTGHASDPHKAIAGAPENAFKLLLAHQPASAAEAAKAGFDLQLSGHTHGGQFFPGTLFAHLVFPFVRGLHKLGEMWVYTSSGTGYVGPRLRTASAEITKLVLVRAP